MKLPIYQVDAFTNKLFGGNPAAVVPLDSWLPKELMQQIAMENNLAETSFFVRKSQTDFELKWFTPALEIDLCGHATLAAAKIIFDRLAYPHEEIHFHTLSGELVVRRNKSLLSLDFPARKALKAEAPEALRKGIGLPPKEIYKARDYMLVYDSEEEVLSLNPDMNLLASVENVIGIIVTAKGKKSDFVSRFFAPAAGIPEDPVTGSAHVTLVPYWAAILNKESLHALQVSKRGGELFCELKEDRVLMSGDSVIFMEGEIQV